MFILGGLGEERTVPVGASFPDRGMRNDQHDAVAAQLLIPIAAGGAPQPAEIPTATMASAGGQPTGRIVQQMPNSCKNDLDESGADWYPGKESFRPQWFADEKAWQIFAETFTEDGQVRWSLLVDTLNWYYQRDTRAPLPTDVHDTWERYVAMAVDWWYDLIGEPRKRRKEVAMLGGYIADYLLTEHSCRSGRWVKKYTVVSNYAYAQIATARSAQINKYSVDNKFNLFMTTGPGDESIGDCFEVAVLIMVSEAAFHPMWDLVELTSFVTDLEAPPGRAAEEMAPPGRAAGAGVPQPGLARQHAIVNLRNARQWRPVAAEKPEAQPRPESPENDVSADGRHRNAKRDISPPTPPDWQETSLSKSARDLHETLQGWEEAEDIPVNLQHELRNILFKKKTVTVGGIATRSGTSRPPPRLTGRRPR